MSTRATYRIKEVSRWGTYAQCFYIHYDGYPEGAWSYFHDFTVNLDSLIKDGRYRSGKAIAAFGMLPFSEFTDSHEVHADTEYRYDLYYMQQKSEYYLEGWKRCYAYTSEENWVKFFDGTMAEFMEKYKPAKEA